MSLKLRLAIIVAGLMILLMGLFSVAALWSAQRDADAEIRSTLRLLFTLLPNRIALPYPGASAGDALRLLDVSQQLRDVRHVRVAVYDTLGSRVSGTVPESNPLLRGFGWLGPGDGSAESRAMRKDIFVDDVKIGYFLITPSPADELGEIQEDFAREIALTGSFAVALVALVYWVLARALAPIDAMRNALKAIEAGDHGARLPSFDVEEMRDLSESFNKMAEALQSTTAERNATLRKLLGIEEATRRSIAHDLHDGLSPYLVAIKPNLHVLQRHFAQNDPYAPCRECVDQIADHVGRLLVAVRDRLSTLHPVEIDTLGLRQALHRLCEGRRGDADRRLDVVLTTIGEWRGFSNELDTSIYRIVQECLTNAIKHSDCTRIEIGVSVAITSRGGAVTVDVHDNGRGAPSEFPASGLGALAMRERAIALGGRFESGADPTGGWRVKVLLPLGEVNAEEHTA
ncbi:MAG: HAMP domain-containing protein [Burkholderiales bacterium]|nr:HAMP domain-containing protein [Burkholderiales bacterium]